MQPLFWQFLQDLGGFKNTEKLHLISQVMGNVSGNPSFKKPKKSERPTHLYLTWHRYAAQHPPAPSLHFVWFFSTKHSVMLCEMHCSS